MFDKKFFIHYSSLGSPERQNPYYISKKVDGKALVYMTMEAEKSHDPPSTSWRSGKAGVVRRPDRQWCRFRLSLKA